MTQFLLSDESESIPEDQHKIMLAAIDIQMTAGEIVELMESEHLSYLEATIQWMEERSIPESMFSKYIPPTIVEKIKLEAMEENLMRPSVVKENQQSSLDFMFS